MMYPADKRILRQYGKKLMHRQAYLRRLDESRFGLFRDAQKSSRPQADIAAAHVAAWRKADLVQGDDRVTLSPTGRAFLRRLMTEYADEAFRAQHGAVGPAAVEGAVRQVRHSPLQWLKARKQSKGFGLQDIDFAAGEELMRDYDRAAFHPRQTMNWQRPIFVDGGVPDRGDHAPVHIVDARRKLQAALDYTGPGLAEVALAVCCAEVGLEECERGFDLPKRSGKLMLKMALTRLSVFYGLQSAAAAAASLRMR